MKDCLLYAGLGFAVLGGIGAITAHRPTILESVRAEEVRTTQQPSQIADDTETLRLAHTLTMYPGLMDLSKNGSFTSWEQVEDARGFRGLDWAAAQAEARRATKDLFRTIEVQSGDTLMGLLVDNGVSENDAQDAIGAMKIVYSPKDLQIGQKVTLNLQPENPQSGNQKKLVGISLKSSAVENVTVVRSTKGEFVAKTEAMPLTTRLGRTAADIHSSLFVAAREAGLPMPVAAEIIKAFSYDVDFQRDIQPGDSFDVVFERMEDKQGNIVKTGKMLYASLTLSGKKLPLYYFEKEGNGQYYSPTGESARKSLLKTPIDGARITSGFGMRSHPILGYTKMHKGMDFGAPSGTPIYAAGDGVILEAAPKGAYGNYVKIRHNGQYQTAYAHVSKFGKGVKKGARVRQGDVIAYVGTTGRSTGPHLHYEILANGVQVNPKSVKVLGGGKLAGKDLKAFQAQIAQIDKTRDKLKSPNLIAEKP